MKKLAIITLAICLGLNSYAQIQTKFWGLEFSSLYQGSLETLKNSIADRCQYATVEGEAIYATDGRFGGYYWDYVQFSFCKRESGRSLNDVGFASSHKTYDEARSRYVALLKALAEKYGAPLKSSDHRNSDVRWLDVSKKYGCTLSLVSPEENEAEKSWCVLLIYTDVDRLRQIVNAERDEL